MGSGQCGDAHRSRCAYLRPKHGPRGDRRSAAGAADRAGESARRSCVSHHQPALSGLATVVLMVAMAPLTDQPRAAPGVSPHPFTPDELSRLMAVEARMAAEQYLVPLDQRCPDHQACRRLAFGMWLRLTQRVAEGIEGPERHSIGS